MVLASLLLGACSPGANDAPTTTSPTRIVLVTLDTLRKDTLTAEHMPAVHALAEEGRVFERFYASAPLTQPTHASLFTGLHPWQHGITRNGMVLPEEHPVLAERLSAAGWSTAAAVSSYPVHRKFGFARGFDAFHDVFDFERKKMPEAWLGEETVGDFFFSLATSTTDHALALLDAMEGERQFLWVHYFDAHSPYGDLVERPVTVHRLRELAKTNEAEELAEAARRGVELYHTDVLRMDGEVARLLAHVLRDADTIETHVLVTVDHGESFGEDDAWGHDHRLTPEQVHVPTFLLSPRATPGRTEEVAGTIDAHATLLALAGIEDGVRGRVLLAPPESGANVAATGMRHYDPKDAEAPNTAPPHFFHASAAGLLAGTPETLRADDAQAGTLPADAHADVRALFALFADELARGAAPAEVDDDETRRALDALGYGGE